jgi:hypothetical protein
MLPSVSIGRLTPRPISKPSDDDPVGPGDAMQAALSRTADARL